MATDTSSQSYRERVRKADGQVIDSPQNAYCGACGLVFTEVQVAGREPHPAHGACPRCGEDRDIGGRLG